MHELAEDRPSARSLLRFPLILEKYRVLILYLMKQGFRSSRSDHVSILEQKARVIILVILTSIIMANRIDSIKFYVLESLKHIDKIKDYS